MAISSDTTSSRVKEEVLEQLLRSVISYCTTTLLYVFPPSQRGRTHTARMHTALDGLRLEGPDEPSFAYTDILTLRMHALALLCLHIQAALALSLPPPLPSPLPLPLPQRALLCLKTHSLCLDQSSYHLICK